LLFASPFSWNKGASVPPAFFLVMEVM